MYLNILKNNLKRSAMKLELLENFCSQQDNDTKHMVKIVKKCIMYILRITHMYYIHFIYYIHPHKVRKLTPSNIYGRK